MMWVSFVLHWETVVKTDKWKGQHALYVRSLKELKFLCRYALILSNYYRHTFSRSRMPVSFFWGGVLTMIKRRTNRRAGRRFCYTEASWRWGKRSLRTTVVGGRWCHRQTAASGGCCTLLQLMNVALSSPKMKQPRMMCVCVWTTRDRIQRKEKGGQRQRDWG